MRFSLCIETSYGDQLLVKCLFLSRHSSNSFPLTKRCKREECLV